MTEREAGRQPEPKPRAAKPEVPDLQTQLEALLDEVWSLEAEWRLDDRIDLALRYRAA